jgi:ABC-type nitrate/sulfonate/bicarbonate transport system substrate-binding protein
MMSDELSPEQVLSLVVKRAWDDDTDDESRKVLEAASHAMRYMLKHRRELMVRCGRMSMALERAEAERDRIAVMCYGPTKGGGH